MENKKKGQDGKKKTSSNGAFKHFWQTLKDPRWLWVGLIVAVIVIILLLISEGQFPNVTLSNGIVAFVSAVIGVLLTAFAISVQLKQQSEGEMQKDKDIRIYQKQIHIYSKFTGEMWKMLENNVITDDELKEIRNICFRDLVFFLDKKQIDDILEHVRNIDTDNIDAAVRAAAEITHILKNSIDRQENKEDKEAKAGDLQNLFRAFKIKSSEKDEEEKEECGVLENNQIEVTEDNNKFVGKEINFWHFNMFGEEQIKAFENNNWVLNLIEYGEEWRTNALKQVQPDDIVFLFRRGGFGYIGAFKVNRNEVLVDKKYQNKEYDPTFLKKFDMYGAMEDGGTYSSNLIVEPIAYNYEGVGCYTVRRRTIERINDMEAVKFLLKKFNGEELKDNQKTGIGKLNKDISLIEEINKNKDLFSSIVKKYIGM